MIKQEHNAIFKALRIILYVIANLYHEPIVTLFYGKSILNQTLMKIIN